MDSGRPLGRRLHQGYQLFGRLVNVDKSADFVGRRALEAETAGGGPARRLVGLAADYVEIDVHGVRVVIDPISLPYLQGSTIDYQDGLMGAGFSFDNPNVASTCGCNASFQARPDVEGPYSPKADGCG